MDAPRDAVPAPNAYTQATAIPVPFALRFCYRPCEGYVRLGQLTCSAASLMFEDSSVKTLTVKDTNSFSFVSENSEISL
jgi:hypothetical protein